MVAKPPETSEGSSVPDKQLPNTVIQSISFFFFKEVSERFSWLQFGIEFGIFWNLAVRCWGEVSVSSELNLCAQNSPGSS